MCLYMSRFANNALLGGGDKVRVGVRKNKERVQRHLTNVHLPFLATLRSIKNFGEHYYCKILPKK